MDILLKAVTIIDPLSPFDSQTTDIFIKDGIISSISDSHLQNADQVIDKPGLFISPGWVDIFSHFSDPGHEYKETLESGAAAAVAGGFTDVFLVPNTTPPVHNKSGVAYLVQKSKALPVSIHPIGAVTKHIEGKEFAEMYDMQQSGAVAFSDGLNSIQSSGVLLKALQYVQAIDKTIIQLPDDKNISPNGLINEGVLSTQLGLPGKPAIAEELMISRDIELVRYTGSKIHFTGISTKGSVELIRKAKTDKLNVTCSVTPYHLCFLDEDLASYDTNLKVNPPLRTSADRQALMDGIKDGTIDCITSHHLPEDVDHKVVEFEYAANGMIGLQTCFAAVCTAIPELSPDRIVELFSSNARQIFELETCTIDLNKLACLTIFSREESWMPEKSSNLSKSANSAFFNKKLNGRSLGIINKGNLFLNT